MDQSPPRTDGSGPRAVTSFKPKLRSNGPVSYPPVREFMDHTFVTLSPETPVFEAIETLLTQRVTGAAVVDSEGALRGMLSEKDCLRVMTQSAYDGYPSGVVADYMTTDLTTIAPDLDVLSTVSLFLEHTFRRFLIVENGKMVGQITRRDLLRVIRRFARENPASSI